MSISIEAEFGPAKPKARFYLFSLTLKPSIFDFTALFWWWHDIYVETLEILAYKGHSICSVIEWKLLKTRLGCFYVTAILSWCYGWSWAKAEVK